MTFIAFRSAVPLAEPATCRCSARRVDIVLAYLAGVVFEIWRSSNPKFENLQRLLPFQTTKDFICTAIKGRTIGSQWGSSPGVA